MTAEELRKSILQMAIQGKLVKQDPNDEPASVLLERIREEKTRLIKEGKIKGKMTDSVICKGSDNSYYEKVGKNEVCIDDEIPFELPDSWAWVRFENLVFFSLGKTPDRKTSKYWKDGMYPWVSISDMVDQGIVIATKDKITETALVDKFNCRLVPKGTLLMSFKLTIGKMSILGVDAQHNEAIISIVPVSDIDDIQKTYLFNTLPLFTSFAETTDAIKGATLNSGKLAKMLVALPPLAEQKRIIERLNELTPLISDYGKLEIEEGTIIEQLPILLRKSILQYAIQGKLVPQDPSDEPTSVLLERIRSEREKANGGKKSKAKTESYIFKNSDDNSYYEKIGEKVVCIDEEIPFDIPDSWCWTRIGCVSNSYIGLTYKPTDVVESGGTIVLRSSNIQNGEIDLTDLVRVNTSISQKLIVEKNDILICARNGSKKLVGKSAIIRETLEDMSFGAFMAICKSPLYEYLYLFLQSNAFYNQLNAVSGTTTINQLTQDRLNHFLIPIPPLVEQRRICEKYGQIKEIASQ